MHTLMMIVAGLFLFGLFLLFGKLRGGDSTTLLLAAKAFIPCWLVVALANLWVGVAHAGYSLRDELPVLLVVFAVPALVASIVIWYLSRNGQRRHA